MNSAEKCSVCGTPLSPKDLGGQCPACLLDLGSLVPPEQAGPCPPPDGRPVRRLGDYELVRQIGRGGMGVVYEAHQVSLNRSVALKMVLDAGAATPTALRRFAIEAEAIAKLDHPHIVPIHEAGEIEGQPFYTMKLVQGRSLAEKICQCGLWKRSSNPSPSKTEIREHLAGSVRLMVKVARAVQYAHQQGVLHRDLKPSNILVDENNEPHLTDFGLAKILSPEPPTGGGPTLTQSGGIGGSPHYMSPEQASGRTIGRASDIFSLGVTLYELLVGKRPFQGDSNFETIRKVIEEEPRRPATVCSWLDKDLDTICIKCLDKDPQHRYSSPGHLADDLERWLENRPIAARRASPVARTRRWVQRNRLGAALIVTLSLLLATAASFMFKLRQDNWTQVVNNAKLIESITRSIYRQISDPGTDAAVIPSDSLAILDNRPSNPVAAARYELSLGVLLDGEPGSLAQRWAKRIGYLETSMEAEMQSSALLGLKMFKVTVHPLSALLSNRVDFLAMNSADYLRAKASAPELSLVVRSLPEEEYVLFVRADAGIRTIQQVSGHSMAFGDTNLPATIMAKQLLVKNGVRGRDLRYEHFSSILRGAANDPIAHRGGDRGTVVAVMDHGFHAGVCTRRQFTKYRHRGLVELAPLPGYSEVYVARGGLRPEVLTAFQNALLSLNGQELWGDAAPNPDMAREFEAVDDTYYKALREALKVAEEEFDDGTATRLAEPPVQPAGR